MPLLARPLATTSTTRATTTTTPNKTRIKMTVVTANDLETFDQHQVEIRRKLREEAAFLTKSLYRTCLRSVRLIRPGNEHDEREFQRLEEKIAADALDHEKRAMEIKSGVFSMTPPVDRQDELRSRAEYYWQHTREHFYQQSDCLFALDEAMHHHRRQQHSHLLARLDVGTVEQYLLLLEKGHTDRQWLLQNMQFDDPYQESYSTERAEQFQQKALDYIRKKDLLQRYRAGLPLPTEADTSQEADDDDDDEPQDDDGDAEEVPAWFKAKFPSMAPKHTDRD